MAIWIKVSGLIFNTAPEEGITGRETSIDLDGDRPGTTSGMAGAIPKLCGGWGGGGGGGGGGGVGNVLL